jgi:hypothetical protein
VLERRLENERAIVNAVRALVAAAASTDPRCCLVCRLSVRLKSTLAVRLLREFESASTLAVERAHDSYLVDPASSHMLVSKIKPCMSKHKPLHGEAANGSLGHP